MINPFQQAQQYQQQAAGVFGQMTGYQAPQYQAPTLGAAPTMAGANVAQYMDPYTEQVIERGQQDIARQQQQALNVLGAQAPRGAFGGDRYGLAEAQTAAEYGRQALDFGAQQRQQAFQQAQAQAQFDIQNQIARQRAQLAQQNLAQQEEYDRSLRQMGIRQQGAQALSGLGEEAFSRGQYGIQQQQMAAQQQMQMQQQLLDAARAQTLANLGYPQQSLTFGQGILSGLPRASITESGKMGLTDILGFGGLF